MAGIKDLTVRLIGKDQGALQAMTGLGQKVDQTAAKTKGFGLTSTAAFAAAGTAAIGLAMKTSATFNDVGTQVMKLQRYTGESAESMSQLRFAAKMSGVDVDSMTKLIGKAANTLDKAKDPMAQFGFAAKGANGELRPMKAILFDAADQLKGMSNAGERAAYAQQLFGKAGADMLPLLMKGKEGIEALMAQTADYNEQLSGDDLAAIKANKEAHRQLDAQMEGVQLRIGRSVMPTLTAFTGLLAKVPGPLMDVAGPLVAVGGGLVAVVGIASKVGSAAQTFGAGFSRAAEGVGNMTRGLGTAQGAIRGLSFAAATAGVIAFTYQMQRNAEVAGEWAAGKTGSGTLPERIAETKRNLDEAKKSLEGYASVDIGDSVHLFGSNEGRAQADKVKQLESALSSLEGQQKSATNTADLQKRGVDELGNAVDDLSEDERQAADETKRVQEAFDKATASLKGYFDEASGRVDTERALMQAHDDLSRSIATNGIYFDNMTQQGRDNRKAFQDAGMAAIDWGLSNVKAGMDADVAAQGVNNQIESLRKQMYAAGFSKLAVDAYVESLRLTPSDVSTAFHAPGLVEVYNYAWQLSGVLVGLAAKFPAAQAGVAAVLNRQRPIGAANGAAVKARPGGQLFQVGEGGEDEVIAPQRMITEAVAAGGGGGGVTVVVNVAGSVVAERDLVKAVRNGVITDLRRTGGTPATYFGG